MKSATRNAQKRGTTKRSTGAARSKQARSEQGSRRTKKDNTTSRAAQDRPAPRRAESRASASRRAATQREPNASNDAGLHRDERAKPQHDAEKVSHPQGAVAWQDNRMPGNPQTWTDLAKSATEAASDVVSRSTQMPGAAHLPMSQFPLEQWRLWSGLMLAYQRAWLRASLSFGDVGRRNDTHA